MNIDCVTSERGSVSPVTKKRLKPIVSRVMGKHHAFDRLERTMESSLEGRLEKAFYVFEASCGMGKTKALIAFTRKWKEEGFPGNGSILIMVATKEEIRVLANRCSLDREDYAVASPDAELCTFGLGRGKTDEAKVLFATHAMALQRIVTYGTFEGILDFHYRGGPRTLRVWMKELFLHHMLPWTWTLCPPLLRR